MTLSGMVVVEEQSSRLDADNVAAFLRSRGLEAIVSSDDAGGEIPALDQTNFVQVLVPASEAEEAKRLIAEAEANLGDDEDGAEDGADDEE